MLRQLLARQRKAQLFFASMPWGAKLAVYAGVFFSFAPLGLLQVTFNLQILPWWVIAVVTVYSGVIAVGYTAAGMRGIQWMPIPIGLHLLLTLGLAAWLPEPAPVTSLEGASLAAMATQLRWVGGLTIVSGILAFYCFLAAIRREGLRFSSAHAEIRLARDIHATLVPSLAGRNGTYEWRGTSKPSGDVGGDLVDVLPGASRWVATLADVSGHGVAAGVLMGMFKTAFRTAAPTQPDPGALTATLNAVLADLRQPHMFITAAMLSAEDDGRVAYVLAGHPPMLHLSRATGEATWVGDSQLALTLIDSVSYDTRHVALAPGDVLLVVTDGLLEVFDRHERELGPDGLRSVVSRVGASAPLSDIERAIFAACDAHGAQTDDQTLLVVRRN